MLLRVFAACWLLVFGRLFGNFLFLFVVVFVVRLGLVNLNFVVVDGHTFVDNFHVLLAIRGDLVVGSALGNFAGGC